MTVDPADMWAYATRPIADPDPNGPLLAVLRAADAAEPRVVRASSGAMVDGRFEVPVSYVRSQSDTVKTEHDDGHVSVLYGTPPLVRSDLADAKRTTRRDVAAVIT